MKYLLLLIPITVFGATNLWDFSQETNTPFMPFEVRKLIYEEMIDDDYKGTAKQNGDFLKFLQNLYEIDNLDNNLDNNLGSQNAVGGKTYYLSGSGITATQSTINLTKFEIAGGTSKLQTADFGDLGCGTIEPGHSSKQEFISFTGVTQNSDGTAQLTGVSRGLSPVSPYTASTTLQTSHSGGSKFVISNSPPCFYQGYANRTASTTITHRWIYDIYPEMSGTTNATTSRQFTTKGYVDGLSNQGAATSTETNGGIVELATRTEVSSTTASSADKPLVVQAQHATSTPGANITASGGSGETYLVMSEDDGKINQSWLDLTEAWTFSGTNTFNLDNSTTTISSATTTFDGTNPIVGIGTTTPTLKQNGDLSIAGDVYIASGLGVGQATTSDGNLRVTNYLQVDNTASTTNLIISNSCDACSLSDRYISSTNISVSTGNTNYAEPTGAEDAIIVYDIGASDNNYRNTGSVTLTKVGATVINVGGLLTGGSGTDYAHYEFTWTGTNINVAEQDDGGTNADIDGKIYWYK